MAEGTPAPANQPTPTTQTATPKQYIRASTDDNALEPDALRGSEQVIRDAKLQDDEADRRKAIAPEKDK
jgi:hypothetical protein